jgi:hypothetical protein
MKLEVVQGIKIDESGVNPRVVLPSKLKALPTKPLLLLAITI